MLPSRILVVDSSPDSRGVLCGLLEELGYKRMDTKQKPWQLPAFLTFDDGEYAFTPDGDGAIQFVAKHDFGRKDLVVTGMFLSFRQTPMSGTNILTGVKNFYSSESKVVVVLPNPVLRRDAMNFDGVLGNPVTLEALRELFRRLFPEEGTP